MVSVIIRTYNEEKFLGELLKKISEQQLNDTLEIIIVDSGSTDKTLEIVNNHHCKIVHIKKEIFSFGRSLNYGCEAAIGDYLVFVSAHCIPVDTKWLAKIIAPLKDEAVALSYGRQVGHYLTKFSEYQVFSKYFPEDYEKRQPNYFCNNANSAIKKTLWVRHQFDENLTGLEDMSWAKHFYSIGYRIEYVPESCVYHIHEESWKKVKLRYEREAYALRAIMPELHFNFLDFIISYYKGVKTDIKKSLLERCFIKNFLSILLFRFCQFYGAYKGHHEHRMLSKRKKQNYFYP